MKRRILCPLAALSLAIAFACANDPEPEGEGNAAVPDAAVEAPDAAVDMDAASGDGADASHDGEAPDAGPIDGGESDAGAAPETGGSGGSGGLSCRTTKSVTTNGGVKLSYCMTRVAESELKVVEPTGVAGPLTLAIYLHGDGARPHVNDTALRHQGDWVAENGVLYVSALAPNNCSWWRAPLPAIGSCDSETAYDNNPQDTEGKNADALREIIEAMRAAYDIDDRRVLLGGSSGGAIMLTASFIPRHGDRYPAAYALACGGEVPWQEFAWDTSDSDLVGGISLSFAYGTGERLTSEITDAHEFYEALGVHSEVRVETPTSYEYNHCHYNQLSTIPDQWDSAPALAE